MEAANQETNTRENILHTYTHTQIRLNTIFSPTESLGTAHNSYFHIGSKTARRRELEIFSTKKHKKNNNNKRYHTAVAINFRRNSRKKCVALEWKLDGKLIEFLTDRIRWW